MTNLLRTIEETAGEMIESSSPITPELMLIVFIMGTILLTMMTWEEKRQERERAKKYD